MPIEVLVTNRRPSRRPVSAWERFFELVLGSAAVGFLAFALTLFDDTAGAERAVLEPGGSEVRVLVLGDSSAGNLGCPGCLTYVEQFAASVEHDTERRVRVADWTWRRNTWPTASVASVLWQLRADPRLREVVSSSDVVVIALGDRDLPPAPRADRCRDRRESRCTARVFRDRLDALLTEVGQIRQQQPVVLRVITSASPTAPERARRQLTRNACQVARRHGGACVDPFRGAPDITPGDWELIAGHPRLSQHGHDVVARELIAIGPG